ncbi:anthranilate N-benzoyltransferase protein 3-like [Chenopodium quinoa]|uniref:Uncharacterized protein n=1 Tax=Chenopodium quinoa TaxID=63459 RepID=A0A803MAA0_CHEQI|nr:anthranilate N-benzoyltransferase protein 3-like [Chenopodium quinoa]
MSVIVRESTMVRPAEETPKRNLWLSRLDMIIRMPYSHTNILAVYSPVKDNNGQKFFDTEILKESLRKILVPFYPMAGRLKKNEENGRYEIDCNAAGALFKEVETTHTLADLGTEFRKVAIPTCDFSGGLSSFPLLMVQVTRFKCGSVCMGCATHHNVIDGFASGYFLVSWARFARGLDLPVMPFHDRALYVAPRDPPQIKFRHLEYEPPLPPILPKGLTGEMSSARECMFKFSKRYINTLKLHATSQPQEAQTLKLSTYEVLAGHIWRSTCRARGLTGDQYVKLYIPTDGRSRLRDPTLPRGYFGNVVFFAACVAKARDITCKPVSYAATMVHEALKKVESTEYLRSAIDYIESQPNLDTLVRGVEHVTCPNLVINSWAKLPFNLGDFGWGKPNTVAQGGIRHEGQAFFIPSPNEEGVILLTIKLYNDHIPLFENYLYDFEITPNL